MFDEQPDGDPHGECAAEIHRLQAETEKLWAVCRDILSVRDQFAKAAMQACISACSQDTHEGVSYCEHVARVSYEMADAMMAVRAAAALSPVAGDAGEGKG